MTRPIRRTLPTLGALLALTAMMVLAVPALAHDHGDDAFGDDPAGTIASFDADSGQLVIDLADGGSISGLVTSFTWIDADNGCDDRRARHHDGGWCRRHGDDDHHGWHHRHDGDAGDLVPGASVDAALLVLKDGRSFYAKVDLDD